MSCSKNDPTPSQVNLNSKVDKNMFESILYHLAVLENKGESAVKKTALKVHDSHGPSG